MNNKVGIVVRQAETSRDNNQIVFWMSNGA